jgi:tetratricopeptide (TPR) repeat protein
VIRNLYIVCASAAFALSACAGPAVGVRKAGSRGGGAAGEPEVSTRAKLMFDDAIKTYDAASKVGAYDYPALERKFKLAAEADPNLAEADYNLGVLAERQGKLDVAASHYESAIRKKPSLRQAAENLAVIHQNRGDVSGAVRIYQQVLESFPDDGASRARVAELARQSGDVDRAMELARDALIREPKTLTAYKVMIRGYIDREQLSMAKLVALRAMKIDANDPELYYAMGLILLKENEREKALLQFKRAVEARPDYLPATMLLARMSLEKEDYTSAEEYLRRILQVNPKSAEAHVNLGVAYKGMGNFDKALQEYDAAEKLDPQVSAIYLNRGVILHRYKNAPEKGIELYKKYLAMNGEGSTLSAEATVFGLLKEAEGTIHEREEAKRMEEEAKRMEAEAKRQEAEQKAEEARLKKEEERIKKLEDQENAAAAKAAGEPESKPAQGPDKDGPKDGAKKDAAKKQESKKAEPKGATAPAKASKKSQKPSDEPADNL